ncbi:MAG: PPOX class F420-dependent oxidoreductase [Propionibacteriales bacterium]|nr:PPOX class F420-dependent oxidoreductase [Propionibacteriales bacterium]
MTIDAHLLALAAGRDLGVLATLKRSGRPQLSNISYHLDIDQQLVRISVTDGRAKVSNVRRDPRVSLLVSSQDGWSYAVLEGTADLSPVAAAPDDATVDELVEVYRGIRGEDHPDWDEYRQVMVDDRRIVLRFTVDHAYGRSRQ